MATGDPGTPGVSSYVPADWRARNAAAFGTSPHHSRATFGGPDDWDAALDGGDGTDPAAEVVDGLTDTAEAPAQSIADTVAGHAATLAEHAARLDALDGGAQS